jgi:hypothetical protein
MLAEYLQTSLQAEKGSVQNRRIQSISAEAMRQFGLPDANQVFNKNNCVGVVREGPWRY